MRAAEVVSNSEGTMLQSIGQHDVYRVFAVAYITANKQLIQNFHLLSLVNFQGQLYHGHCQADWLDEMLLTNHIIRGGIEMKKVLLTLLAAICLVVFVYSGYQIYLQLSEYNHGKNLYSSLENYAVTPTPDESRKSIAPASGISLPEVDFAALSAINPDIVGWLYCEDTVINYPVVQSNDNSYYLKHLFDGGYNANGCLFLDSQNASIFTDAHSIIYGHYMKNGTMFSSLVGYKEQAYYDQHPRLVLVTPVSSYVIEIFAGYVTSAQDDAWKIEFNNETEFEQWISVAIEKSMFKSDISPVSTDRIITLSTCSYEFSDARFVVLGVMKVYS